MSHIHRGIACGVAAWAAVLFAHGPVQASEFAPAVSYMAGKSPHGVAAGDFNGDGIPDLAVANYISNTVSILVGNGDGTYKPHVDYPTGPFPSSVAVGDFNGDHKLDLVTTNTNNFKSGANITVLLGNGNGTFKPSVPYASPLGAPFFVAVADLNADQKLDLAVASHGGDVAIYLGNGDGTFQPGVNYPAGANPQALAIADLNGDGEPDIVVANKSSNNISILMGRGDGTFKHPTNIVVGTQASDVTIADFNGDQKQDLAVTNFKSNNLCILLGNGDGTFQTPSFIAAGTNPAGLAVADFDGDGNMDIVESNQALSADTVGVFLGRGDGTFRPPSTYPAGGGPGLLIATDLNLDGKPDVAVADFGSELDVLLNTGQ